jgi:hypothetical protein
MSTLSVRSFGSAATSPDPDKPDHRRNKHVFLYLYITESHGHVFSTVKTYPERERVVAQLD